MNANDRDEFRQILTGLAEIKCKTLSAPAQVLYWNALKHWPLEEVREAAAHLLLSTPFMPQPSDFEKLLKAGRPTAGEAFARAIEHCKSSRYRQGGIGDPLIDRAVAAIGGYHTIARHDEDNLHFLERRFTPHYDAMRDVDDVREALPQIAAAHTELKLPHAGDAPKVEYVPTVLRGAPPSPAPVPVQVDADSEAAEAASLADHLVRVRNALAVFSDYSDEQLAKVARLSIAEVQELRRDDDHHKAVKAAQETT